MQEISVVYQPFAVAMEAGEIEVCAVGRGPYPGKRIQGPEMPELLSVGYWDARQHQRWGLDWHQSGGIELTFLHSGGVDFGIDGKSHQLRSGDLTITRPWQTHRFGAPHIHASRLTWLILDVGARQSCEPWQWPDWLLLSVAERERLGQLLHDLRHPVFRASAEVVECLEHITDLLKSFPGHFDQTRTATYVNQLLLALTDLLTYRESYEEADDAASSTRFAVESFLGQLERRCGKEWTVDQMAEACGLKRSQFTAHCRQITNMSPMEYLNQHRVASAQQLLKNEPAKSITNVGLACGFSSGQYFAEVFRRLTGRTPREVRSSSKI